MFRLVSRFAISGNPEGMGMVRGFHHRRRSVADAAEKKMQELIYSTYATTVENVIPSFSSTIPTSS